MFVLCAEEKTANGKGGESYLIAGVISLAVSVYSALGVWSLWDRLRIYCPDCQSQAVLSEFWQTEYEKSLTETVCYGAAMGVLLVFRTVFAYRLGIVAKIPNGTVLFVACLACIAAIAATKFVPSLKALLKTSKTQSNALRECQCGKSCGGKLNKFLLLFFLPRYTWITA